MVAPPRIDEPIAVTGVLAGRVEGPTLYGLDRLRREHVHPTASQSAFVGGVVPPEMNW
jgi:hypothetical protein